MKATGQGYIIGTALQNAIADGTTTVFIRPGFAQFDPGANRITILDDSSAWDTLSAFTADASRWMYGQLSAEIGFFDKLYANHLAAHSAVIDDLKVNNGIEMRDRATGAIYCAFMDAGSFQQTDGPCTDAPSQTPTSVTIMPDSPEVNPGITSSSSTPSTNDLVGPTSSAMSTASSSPASISLDPTASSSPEQSDALILTPSSASASSTISS
jgi:hypothetical protein